MSTSSLPPSSLVLRPRAKKTPQTTGEIIPASSPIPAPTEPIIIADDDLPTEVTQTTTHHIQSTTLSTTTSATTVIITATSQSASTSSTPSKTIDMTQDQTNNTTNPESMDVETNKDSSKPTKDNPKKRKADDIQVRGKPKSGKQPGVRITSLTPASLRIDYKKSIEEKRRLQSIRKIEREEKEESDRLKQEKRLRHKQQLREKEEKERHRGVVVRPSDDMKKLQKARKKQLKLLSGINVVTAKDKNFFKPR